MITRRDSMLLLGATALSLSMSGRSFAAPMRVTADSVDPLFTEPFLDIDE